MPRWKLTEAAFIDNCLVEADKEITTANDIIPGPHMEPLDDAARALADRYADRMQPVGNVLDQLTAALDEARAQAQLQAVAQAQTMAQHIGPALGQAVAQAVAQAMAVAQPPAPPPSDGTEPPPGTKSKA